MGGGEHFSSLGKLVEPQLRGEFEKSPSHYMLGHMDNKE